MTSYFTAFTLSAGTPLQNNLHELWSLLNFLHPDLFHSAERFDACFDISTQGKHRIDRALLMKVHDMMKPFMLRRVKADVEKTVPPKVEKKVMCPLTPVQTMWYKRLLVKDSSLVLQLEHEDAYGPGSAVVPATAAAAAAAASSSSSSSTDKQVSL